MTSKKVVTRFAPSPTGFLHIGGARTALFNWLFSQHHGGTFRLRVEDTDRERSTDEATQAILDGMSWLGLSHDDEIVYQSRNADRHAQIANTLLESGAAYKCYATPEELDVLREQARESSVALRSPYRDTTDAKDLPFTVRFRVPEGQTTITDHVQGEITWENAQFDDLVLLRADGTPTYMLAVVVDDHDMGVTHVIRGDDHLINAGRQSLIYQALGWDIPEFAHVPLIHGPDGKKLSKRHGALGVEAYRDMGYLPTGLRNYLLKLGWSNGDQELFFEDDAVKAFSLEGINNAPARLDFDKMGYINAQHLAREDGDSLLAQASIFLEAVNGGPLDDVKQTRVKQAIPTLKPRAQTLEDFATQARYLLLERPLEITGKARKSLKNDAVSHIEALTLELKALDPSQWTAELLQALLTDYAKRHDIGFGKIGQPLRAALTAGAPSPDLSWVLALLGKDETLARLDDVVKNWKEDAHGK